MLKFRMLILLSCILLLAFPVFAQDARPTVGLGDTGMGQVLVGPNGMTLYIFTVDPLDASNCYEGCAERWAPLIVFNADNVTVAEGLPGEIGTIERTTGTIQVTYNGMPLYYWFADTAPGDTRGNGVGGNWWVVPPATVYIEQDDALGSVLVGPTGKTLYMFLNDEAGVSNCYDQCATNWPPLLVDDAEAFVAGVNLPGALSTVERTDGTYQVAYNGMPLYYWKDDAARGDTLGEGVGDNWFTIVPETVVWGSNDELGNILVSPTGRTLYTFMNDEAGVSNCTGDCAANWPPFTIAGTDRLAPGADVAGELGTIVLENGRQQVTYNGMPLYFFAEDRAPGDTNGQGVGEVWWVVTP
jgi:predicted lipoprotein with Yx(FWY)xxD motif